MRIYVKPIHMQQQLGRTSFVCSFVHLFGVTYAQDMTDEAWLSWMASLVLALDETFPNHIWNGCSSLSVTT